MKHLLKNSFAEDVLDILRRRKVTLRGLKPEYLEIFLGGEAKMWFYGHENGRVQRKGITVINAGGIDQAVQMGKPEILAHLIEEAIDHSQSRFY